MFNQDSSSRRPTLHTTSPAESAAASTGGTPEMTTKTFQPYVASKGRSSMPICLCCDVKSGLLMWIVLLLLIQAANFYGSFTSVSDPPSSLNLLIFPLIFFLLNLFGFAAVSFERSLLLKVYFWSSGFLQLLSDCLANNSSLIFPGDGVNCDHVVSLLREGWYISLAISTAAIIFLQYQVVSLDRWLDSSSQAAKSIA